MDSTDFEMPSPKRQKTNSPVQAPTTSSLTNTLASSGLDHSAEEGTKDVTAVPTTTPSIASDQSRLAESKEEDMLDVLMQHVESEAASKDIQIPGLMAEQELETHHVGGHKDETVEELSGNAQDSDMTGVELPMSNPQSAQAEPYQPLDTTPISKSPRDAEPSKPPHDIPLEGTALPKGLEPADPGTIDHLRTVAEVNALPATSDILVSDQIPPATEVVEPTASEGATVPSEAREWETDSSPYDSSSSDDSSTDSDSSDDDEDEDDEYTLLDPYEQARILMAEDGGGGGDDGNSDDEGRTTSTRQNAGLRTVNEKPEEILPKPNITITESMPIEELGSVQAIVENTVLITAKTSGEYRVLESHSLLCTASRIPIGVVAETLGRVEAPLYTVRFASASDITESGVSEKGTKIYYVPDHSTFVFTQPLKAVKGSDASNFHDEEVGDDEMEFSDDEAEAEHKRQLKLKRKGIDPASIAPPSRGGRGGRGQRGRGGRGGSNNMHTIPNSDTASAYGSASVEMNYDEVEDGETDYTPLRRPDTMNQTSPHHINGAMSPPQRQQQPQQQFNFRGNQDSRGGRGGPRGRGGNPNHSNRSRGGRAGYPHNQNNNRTSYSPTYNQNSPTSNAPRTLDSYTPSSYTSMYSNTSPVANPHQQAPFHTLPTAPPLPPPPAAPYLTPSSGPFSPSTGSYTVPPSPMTPLPAGNGSWLYGHNTQYQGHGQMQQQQQQQQQSQQQSQQQNQWAHYHANLNQYQQQGGTYGNGTANADAIAQVQRTLEELRRNGGNAGYGGGGYNTGQQ